MAIADFRKVWAVSALSGVVRWLEMLAFAVYVFDVTNSPFLVTLVSLLRILPLALFGAPWAPWPTGWTGAPLFWRVCSAC
ncbi:MAG: hypothetical protein VCE75_18740 [Alphaproteobacteria bacterium]